MQKPELLLVLVPLLLAGAAFAQVELTPLPAGAETSRVKARCTACHGIEYVTRQPRGRGAAWWTKTVDDMVDTHGADIPDSERKALTAFLTRVNSADGKP